MKYRVVKDDVLSCEGCVMFKDGHKTEESVCDKFIADNNLPDCAIGNCHFEEIEDTITTKDLQDIDEAHDGHK